MPQWDEPLDEQGWVLLDRPLDGQALLGLRAGQVPRWAATLRDQLEPIAHRWLSHLGPAGGAARAAQAVVQAHRLTAGQALPLSTHHAPDRFPLQLLILLDAPGRDFTGGQTIAVEQRPRMQSRPAVLPLEQGSVAICATGPRPVQGRQGHYTTVLRLGAGPVLQGERQCCLLGWQL
ncbi:2OG-Fe(II) oxygenase [Bordetella genomosp. 12]|uniref:Prolyl 4-hydroxylase n=1 Tax=Bordetella genomosp. 12 TaxID=463035 RepID=A0A261VTX9_9BORD|nr:2OG-Fe(II) oxygenase [Bordetella genomosp. 12]OZI77221.1 hypothetical protein CAL22_01310 [Bordetella genomosp. 12]